MSIIDRLEKDGEGPWRLPILPPHLGRNGKGENPGSSVICGRRGEIDARICMGCDQAVGWFFKEGDARSFILCQVAPPPPDQISNEASPNDLPASANATAVKEVMTHQVVCLSPKTALGEAVAIFAEKGISGAPVVDPSGHPVGVVSNKDLLRAQDAGQEVTIENLMTPLAFSLQEDAPLAHAAALMAYENIHRLPIVSGKHRVVGILSTLDVVRWLARQSGFQVGS